jgi:hypothetical protein
MYRHGEVRQGLIPHFRVFIGGFGSPVKPFPLNDFTPKIELFEYL